MRTQHDTTAAVTTTWAILSDLPRWPDWLATVTSAVPVDPQRVSGTGATYVLRQPWLPPARWTVTEWLPGSGFTWESRTPGVRTVGRHALEPTGDGGTTITLGIEWIGPLSWLARLLYRRLTAGNLRIEAAALARTAQARS
jgi:hypothetical protein